MTAHHLPWLFRGLASVLLVVVVAEAAIGIWLFRRTSTFLETARAVTGEVVELRESRGSEGGTTWSPVFTWTDAAGVAHRDTASFSSSPPSHEVGDPIDLLHDPADPTDVRVDGFFSLWLGPLVLGFVAAVGLVFVLVLGLLLPWVLNRAGARTEDETRSASKAN